MNVLRLWSLASVVLLIGCATTSKGLWESRIGKFTYEQAVRELGKPETESQTRGGNRVVEWHTQRGSPARVDSSRPAYTSAPVGSVATRTPVVVPASPDRYIRLTFAPDGRLIAWAEELRYAK